MDPFDLKEWRGYREAGGDSQVNSVIDLITIDSRRIDSPHALFVALPGMETDGHHYVSQAARSGAKFALVKKGWKCSEELNGLTLLFVENPLEAFQEIAGAYRASLGCKVIGIAGSYGKTMVKDLLHHILSQRYQVASSPESFNSQIGVPLSLLTIKKNHHIALIEAGISQKKEMESLRQMILPNHAIVTHVGKKHLTTLGSLAEAAEEMSQLLVSIPNSNWVIVPNDPHLSSSLPRLSAQRHFWSEKEIGWPHAHFDVRKHGSYILEFPSKRFFEQKITHGYYYILDLLNIVTKAAWLLGVNEEEMTHALKNYQFEPIRTEIWKSGTGVTFVNETYGSDPLSVDKALKHFKNAPSSGKKIFLFGGLKDEVAPSTSARIGKAINRSKIDMLLLYGNRTFSSLTSEISNNLTQVIECPDLKTAFNLLKEKIGQNDTVLLKGDKKESLNSIIETFNESISSNQCIINLAVIENNLSIFRKKLPSKTRIMAMCKANGYGTDAVQLGKFLISCGIDILGVSYVDEGVALQSMGVNAAIFVINAALHETAKVVKWGFEVGVSSADIISSLAEEGAKAKKVTRVHLHIDTGMGRLGCRPEETLELAQLIKKSQWLELAGIMTHFACAENKAEDPFTSQQASCFQKCITQLQLNGIDPPWKHASNSSAVARFDFPEFNMVRIGIGLFGLYASAESKKSLEIGLAISLITRIVGINICKPGESISYGRHYIAESERRIAVLPIGYFDGLHRGYSGKGFVMVKGHKAPMVGSICMDFMMIDITEIPEATIGDPVLIFGEDEYGQYLAPEDLAKHGNTVIHELVTCLGPRIQRVFLHEEGRSIR